MALSWLTIALGAAFDIFHAHRQIQQRTLQVASSIRHICDTRGKRVEVRSAYISIQCLAWPGLCFSEILWDVSTFFDDVNEFPCLRGEPATDISRFCCISRSTYITDITVSNGHVCPSWALQHSQVSESFLGISPTKDPKTCEIQAPISTTIRDKRIEHDLSNQTYATNMFAAHPSTPQVGIYGYFQPQLTIVINLHLENWTCTSNLKKLWFYNCFPTIEFPIHL